jgi:hypothetical protein
MKSVSLEYRDVWTNSHQLRDKTVSGFGKGNTYLPPQPRRPSEAFFAGPEAPVVLVPGLV